MNCSFPPWAVKGHCLQAIAEPSPTPGCQIPPCVPQHCPRGTSPHASLSQLLTASPPTSALLTRSPTVGASPEPLVAGFHPPAWLHHGAPAEILAGIPKRASHPRGQQSSAEPMAWAEPSHPTRSRTQQCWVNGWAPAGQEFCCQALTLHFMPERFLFQLPLLHTLPLPCGWEGTLTGCFREEISSLISSQRGDQLFGFPPIRV